MKGPTPRRLLKYVRRCLGLGDYLNDPGDGRTFPQIPAPCLLWGLVMGKVLRVGSFLGVEQGFGDDALAYFTERLSTGRLRQALAGVLRRAKRNKAFESSALLGLAVDGTGAGRSRQRRCELCHRQGNGWGHMT